MSSTTRDRREIRRMLRLLKLTRVSGAGQPISAPFRHRQGALLGEGVELIRPKVELA